MKFKRSSKYLGVMFTHIVRNQPDDGEMKDPVWLK